MRRPGGYAVGIGAAALLLLGEVWARQTQTMVRRADAGPIESLSSDAGLIYHEGPPGWGLTPGADVRIRNHFISHRNVRLEVNSLGLRGPEPPAPREPGVRVLFLGDSITLAAYLPEEETFVAIAGDRLRKLAPDRPVVAINAGADDIGLAEQVERLEELAPRLHPDVVVLDFYLNDGGPGSRFAQEIAGRGAIRRWCMLCDRLYSTARLVAWAREQGREKFAWIWAVDELPWRTDRDAFAELTRLARFDWGMAWEEQSWTAVERGLDRIAALSDKLGFEVLAVAFPVRYQVEAEFVVDGPQRRLEQEATKRGWPTVDLLAAFRASGEPLFYDFCHLRPEGNRIAAEHIADALAELSAVSAKPAR